MTAPDLAETVKRIRELAAKATPGPWNADSGVLWVEGVGGGMECCNQPLDSGECCGNGVDGRYPTQEQFGGASEPDAAYIAAANPQAILAILAELERVTGERDAARAEGAIRHASANALAAEMIELWAQVTSLEREHAEAKARADQNTRWAEDRGAKLDLLLERLAQAKARTPGTVEVCGFTPIDAIERCLAIRSTTGDNEAALNFLSAWEDGSLKPVYLDERAHSPAAKEAE